MLTVTPSAMADMHGIDVSGWQSPTVTCTADYDFAVVKATQGTGFTNSYITSQAQCVRQRGKSLGFYHYAGGGNATAEADHFVNTIRPYLGSAVLVLDWESYQNAAWGDSNWIRVFVNRVHARTGVWPLAYTSAAHLWQIPSDVRAHCGLWVAQYANNNATGYQTRPWNYGRYGQAMRQYTSNGRINGYAGPLDLNYFRGTSAQWNKYANPNGHTTAPKPNNPAPQPSRPDTGNGVSVTVRSGDTISGIAVREHRHGHADPRRQARRDAERHLRRVRLAARRPAQQPEESEPHPSRTAAALLSPPSGYGLRHHAGGLVIHTQTNPRRTRMDISAATTLAAGIVALVAPALVQAFKKYIPADYAGLTSLGVIAIAAANGFHGYS